VVNAAHRGRALLSNSLVCAPEELRVVPRADAQVVLSPDAACGAGCRRSP
jgi:hypothetical protein